MGVLANNFKSEVLPVSQSKQMEHVCLLVLQTIIPVLYTWAGGVAWESLILRAGAPGEHRGEHIGPHANWI